MGKSFHSVPVHLAWATALRRALLVDGVQVWLWPMLADKAAELGSTFTVVGGMPDHVHVLMELPVTMSIAEVVRRLKGASSRIAHLRGMTEFSWQEGYGVFAIGRSDLDRVAAYIRRQRERHGADDIWAELEEFP